MIKRIAAITGVVVACAATALVAVAIWPERTAESGSTPTAARAEGAAGAAAPGAGADLGQRRRGRARGARRRHRDPLHQADESAGAGDGPHLHPFLHPERAPRPQ